MDRELDGRDRGAGVGGAAGEGAVPAGRVVVAGVGGEADVRVFFVRILHAPASTLFPYTTLFRSVVDRFDGEGVAGAVEEGGAAEAARPAAGAGGGDVVG